MRTPALLLALALAACNRQGDSPANQSAPVATPKPAEAPPAKAVDIDEKTALLDYHLGWPAEVSAIPALAQLIRGPAEKGKADLLKAAADDKATRAKDGYPFNSYEASTQANVAGSSERLLSLGIDAYEYSGGAHPNHGTTAMLWDRTQQKAVTLASLFTGGETALEGLLRAPYCAGLDKQRKDKRGPEEPAETGMTDDPFNQCPKFSELALIPLSAKGARVFDRIELHADPYVAGPYAEGDYDVELPVTAALIAALKPEYRASFAAPR